MTKQGFLACAVALVMGFGSSANAQRTPQAVPDEPFTTFHLMAVEPTDEGALKAAIDDFNGEFKKEGCAGCAYHLLRMLSGSQTPYNFAVYADWPSQSEYTRIHDSVAYASTAARNPVFAALEEKQFYGRFIEIH
jgi:hypothetical protein